MSPRKPRPAANEQRARLPEQYFARLKLTCPEGANIVDSSVYRQAAQRMPEASAAVVLDVLMEIKAGKHRLRQRWMQNHERKRERVAKLANKMAKYVTEFPIEFSPSVESPDLASLLRTGADRIREGIKGNLKPSSATLGIRCLGEAIPPQIRGRARLIAELLGVVGIKCLQQSVTDALRTQPRTRSR